MVNHVKTASMTTPKEVATSNPAGNRHAAVAIKCGDPEAHYYSGDFFDYVIAIFEGETLGDAMNKFAEWKLDDATMNLDMAWRCSEKMRKAIREWFFPPAPDGFDFAAVESQEPKDFDYYSTSRSPRNIMCADKASKLYYGLPYQDQFHQFIGAIKFYGQQAEQGVNIKGKTISIPYPHLFNPRWKLSDGFDEMFAYTPYFNDDGMWPRNYFEILDTAIGAEAVASLKDRYSGIDIDNLTEGLREAYKKGQFVVSNQWGEDEDLQGTRVEAKGMFFTRFLCGVETDEYGWQLNLRLWPKNKSHSLWPVDFNDESILDRMVIDWQPIVTRNCYAKWWLSYQRKPRPKDPVEEGQPLSVWDLLNFTPLDPNNEQWLLRSRKKGAEVPPSGGRDVAKLPNLSNTSPSFAALLLRYVRDKFDNDAPSVYRRAHVSRKTYSSIVSNELRPVSKPTAIRFALALQLSVFRNEVGNFLATAGYALSDSILEDIVVKACFGSEIYDVNRVNEILLRYNAKPLL